MESPSSRKRLEQLALDAGVFLNKNNARLRRETYSFINPGDKELAENLLKKNRQEAFSSKSHVFRRQPSKSGFKHDEIYTAMESIIRNQGLPGVVECLIAKSNDAKQEKNLFKPRRRLTAEKINPLLVLATETRQSGMVHVLSQQCDQAGLDAALAAAVASRDLDCMKILLENGADPNSNPLGFRDLVESGDVQVIKLLLSAEQRMGYDSLDYCIPKAVARGSLDVVTTLLQSGASADSEQVLESAVSMGRVDIAAALVLAERPPSQTSLDRAAGLVIYETKDGADPHRKLIEILLCAGAKGEAVNKGLVKAVERNDEYLVTLVLRYGRPGSLNVSDAVICALTLNNFQLLDMLLEAHLSADQASGILWTLPTVSTDIPSSRRLRLIHALVQHGAYGDSLHLSLVDAVQRKDSALVDYLVEHGASVDYDNAQALRFTIASCSLPLYKVILKGKPSQSTLELCFPLLDDRPSDVRLSMTKELLKAGAKGGMVAKALKRVVFTEYNIEKELLIQLLVRHGADVNVDNGDCFEEASRTGNLSLLKLLSQGQPSAASLARGVPPAIVLPDASLRFRISDFLLSVGARGPLVDHALTTLTNESPVDMALLKVFLEKGMADVNAENGRAIEQATRRGHYELLQVLLQYQPSVQSANAAFPSALALKDPAVQYQICQQLLTAGVKGEPLDSGLVAVQRSQSNHPMLLELLMAHGANVEYNNGCVIRWAIRGSDERQLVTLMSGNPSVEILAMAFDLVVMVETTKRNEMGRILLDAGCALVPEVIDRALAEATKMKRDISFLQLLLEYGASVNYQRGQAIRSSINNLFFNAFDLLLQHQPTEDTLDVAFKAVWALGGQNRYNYSLRIFECGYHGAYIHVALLEAVEEGPSDIEMIKLLLAHGASVHFSNSQCLVHSAVSMDHDTLKVLLEYVVEREAVSYVFEHTVASSKAWVTALGLPIVQLLLGSGATGQVVDAAFLELVEHFPTVPRGDEFVDLFLNFKADVNYQGARALNIAVASGNAALVRKIVMAGPSIENVRTAFSNILALDLSEDATYNLLEIFIEHAPDAVSAVSGTAYDHEPREQWYPPFIALNKWPRGTKVLGCLLQSGFQADRSVPYVIDDQYGVEQVSLLLWAFLQPQQRISSYAIECLLDNGANANFQSNGSYTTPLLVAAMERTTDVVLKLVQHGADASLSDKNGQTPLLHASKRGQVATMRHLLEAGATINDGSVHEAARELRSEAVQLLLDYGHDPNFPSIAHEGRCALAELCLHASDANTPVSKIRQTIDVLVAGNANLTIKSQDKPLLIHALDNPISSANITKALLASGMWRLINEEFNFYTCDGAVFSPTMYISKNLARSPKDVWPELLYILKANGCKDVYYKLEGPQPPDMVGAPNAILAEEKRRKMREQRMKEQTEEHNLALRRERDIADQQEQLQKRAHALRLQQDQETADQRDAATENSANLQRRLESEATTQRQRMLEAQRNADLAHQRVLNQLRLDTVEKEGRLQLDYQKNSAQLQQSVLDAKMNAESRRVKELESAGERQYKRDLDVMARQEKIMATRKGLMDEEKALLAAPRRKPTPTQKAICNGDDLD